MAKIDQRLAWIKQIYGERPAVIGVSGGVDSAVCLTLLTKALGTEKVVPVCLPYGDQEMSDAKLVIEFNRLIHKAREIEITEMVDLIATTRGIREPLRKGNVMARVRMICLFDIAKEFGALVCGTENRSEHLLGYFTRFGDGASDVEPIIDLDKTQVWELARELQLPEIFCTKAPSAGLWRGQSDEEEMGFSYAEADKVLQGQTEGLDPKIVEKVRAMVAKNKFKLEVPYMFS